MSIQASYFKKVFHFNFKARTSRGLMKDKTSWFIRLAAGGIAGVGECGPLPGLSIDHHPGFEATLQRIVDDLSTAKLSAEDEASIMEVIPAGYPSVRFGLETAWRDLRNGGKHVIYDNTFLEGKPIAINGLIWMGDLDFMMDQINKKVSEGFTCLKLKVGGLDFERECDILRYIRSKYFREKITIRLDANGAFKPDEVLFKLEEMARYDIHSIEQPLKPGQKEMEELCRKSPIPVAFDEELIGVFREEEKRALLEKLRPRFIVLKPTLHGGFSGCAEWISLAEQLNIGWWITSALESSVGLNAICQFTANYHTSIPQGLGTGAIYQDNFSSPLKVADGKIWYDAQCGWDTLEG